MTAQSEEINLRQTKNSILLNQDDISWLQLTSASQILNKHKIRKWLHPKEKGPSEHVGVSNSPFSGHPDWYRKHEIIHFTATVIEKPQCDMLRDSVVLTVDLEGSWLFKVWTLWLTRTPAQASLMGSVLERSQHRRRKWGRMQLNAMLRPTGKACLLT